MRIAHVLNIFSTDRADLELAQQLTIASMRRARDLASKELDIRFYSVQTKPDRILVPKDFMITDHLERSILDIGNFSSGIPFPIISDIYDRVYNATDADVLIYTNADIHLMPSFYQSINAMLKKGYDAFSITRRTIRFKNPTVEQLPLMYTKMGKRHGGHDCFVCSRTLYPSFVLGTVCVGVVGIGLALLLNFRAHAANLGGSDCGIFNDRHLTFHIGNALQHTAPIFDDVACHNIDQVLKIARSIQEVGSVEIQIRAKRTISFLNQTLAKRQHRLGEKSSE